MIETVAIQRRGCNAETESTHFRPGVSPAGATDKRRAPDQREFEETMTTEAKAIEGDVASADEVRDVPSTGRKSKLAQSAWMIGFGFGVGAGFAGSFLIGMVASWIGYT